VPPERLGLRLHLGRARTADGSSIERCMSYWLWFFGGSLVAAAFVLGVAYVAGRSASGRPRRTDI